MENPLESVPLNTEKVYVMATTKTGCEIYMPVNSQDDVEINKKKDDLQKYLDANVGINA